MQFDTYLIFLVTTAVVVFSPGAAAVAVAAVARLGSVWRGAPLTVRLVAGDAAAEAAVKAALEREARDEGRPSG